MDNGRIALQDLIDTLPQSQRKAVFLTPGLLTRLDEFLFHLTPAISPLLRNAEREWNWAEDFFQQAAGFIHGGECCGVVVADTLVFGHKLVVARGE